MPTRLADGRRRMTSPQQGVLR